MQTVKSLYVNIFSVLDGLCELRNWSRATLTSGRKLRHSYLPWIHMQHIEYAVGIGLGASFFNEQYLSTA